MPLSAELTAPAGVTGTDHRSWTVSRYLLRRLEEAGLRHLFGVPGDYVLDFLDEVVASPVRWVGTCNELNAGYAADAYARLNGIGGAVVTYCVGGLSILNAVAGAYAERVPLVVISGAPATRRRETGALVHHLVSDYYLQLELFKKVTADAALLCSPETAPGEIDRVIRNAVTRKLPVYLEIPADLAHAACRRPAALPHEAGLDSDRESLDDCVDEAAGLIQVAADPVVLAGVEVPRFGLGGDVLTLVEAVELPFATMVSSKSALPELHPQFIGIYQGAWSREAVRRQVESSDCLLSLGAWMTDIDSGMFSMDLDRRRMIAAGDGSVRIRSHHYHDVQLGDFVRRLAAAVQPRSYLTSHPAEPRHAKGAFVPDGPRPLTAPRLYERLNKFLDDRMVLLAEPGDAFCAAPDFDIDESENFIVQAFYSSIGYCTPAALGVALARPDKRPCVLTGDGAFQMTAQELGTLIRERCPGVFLLINNNGYLIERMLHTDGPYNDLHMWNYAALPDALGGNGRAKGIRATTEGELELALAAAKAEPKTLFLIEAVVAGRGCSEGLKRLGAAFRRK
jgi:TPP-dependent 2-oxoacid decarboxylase